MLKKYQKDIIELFLISVLWLAPAVRALFDYRTVVSMGSFLLILLVFFFLNRKGYALAISVVLLVISCLVDKSSIFTVAAPVILLYINRYFLSKEKISKKTYNSINPFITGAVILFMLQTVLAFIETPINFEMVWKSGTTYYVAVLLIVLTIPLAASFKNKKIKKEELTVFRIICLCAIYGIVLTTYYHFIKNGFYNHNLYVLKAFPWFVFVYTFIKGNGVCKLILFEKAYKTVEKFAIE